MNRNTLLLIGGISLLLSGCFKEENIILGGKHYYVSYIANGESVLVYTKITEDDPRWVGRFNDFDEEYNKYYTEVAILEQYINHSLFGKFVIYMEDQVPMQTNTTYTFLLKENDPDNLVLNGSLYMHLQYQGNEFMSASFHNLSNLNSQSRFTITEVSPTSIRGTFSGNFFKTLLGGETVSIQNGEFYMPLVQ